jgi:general stress protein YciG
MPKSEGAAPKQRGFARMVREEGERERQREIARKGGRAAHEKGTAHEFTTEEAREAGRKGGSARRRPAGEGGFERSGAAD